MSKQAYLDALRQALISVPEEDIAASLAFYAEMIDDRVEAGLSEEEAVAALVSPQKAAQELRLGLPLPTLITMRCRPARRWSAWEVVLLALGAPIWLSLLIAAVAVVLSVYAALWAVMLSLWAVDIALAGIALGSVTVCATTLSATPADALLYLGAGLLAAAMAIAFGIGCHALTGLFVKLSAAMLRAVKRLFIKKEAAK